MAPISTLERFDVYCWYKQIISGSPPGAAQRVLGIAQAVARHRPVSTLNSKLNLKLVVGDGQKRKVEAGEVAERIVSRSAPGSRW